MVTGVLPRGSINDAAREFNLTRRTVSKIWNQAKKQKAATSKYDMKTKYTNCGRKRVQVPTDEIASLTMGMRTCIRDLASHLNVSSITIWRMIKKGQIKPHTNPLHPGLKDPNMITRLEHIMRMLIGDTTDEKEDYIPMFDFVHLGEKRFYLTRKSQRVYLARTEKGKHRSAKSSKFIPKVMFTAVVARPIFNAHGECIFDGKIGVFPFIYTEPAKRSLKNRKKGTPVTKVIESVTKNVTRDTLINQIIPAIKAKWPSNASKVIFIQQDNARTHITQDDPLWQQVYQQDGFTFILYQQPPNSPYLNVLDLGFFNSIQSLFHKKMLENINEMLDKVNIAFNQLEPRKLSNVWLTLQYVMNEILKAHGSNQYEIPHVNKSKLLDEGRLPTQIKAPKWAVKECWDLIRQAYNVANEVTPEDAAVEETTIPFGEGTSHAAQFRVPIPFGEGTSNNAHNRSILGR